MRIYKFAVCGGDESALRLCRLLTGDGHQVKAFGFDAVKLPEGVMRVGCPEGCFKDADAVILPLPAAREDGRLNAPFCQRSYDAGEILEKIPAGTITLAGQAETLPERAYIEDYALRPECAAGLAVIEAEGAVEAALGGTDRTVCASHALIIGAGALSGLLAPRLRGLGAKVTVAACREGELAVMRAQGFDTVRLDKLKTEGFDVVFSTMPSSALSPAQISAIPPDALFLELSHGCGAGSVKMENLSGKCAPETTAELIRNSVYAILEEWQV